MSHQGALRSAFVAAHQTARRLCAPGEHIWRHFAPEDTETVAKTLKRIEDGGGDGSDITILRRT